MIHTTQWMCSFLLMTMAATIVISMIFITRDHMS